MPDVSKTRVAVRDIVPSATNPRGDFGDIAALADTIRATGGEPVNPPVLVRDGNVFRIVDGERRYRALCEIYGEDSEREVDAIVYDSLDEANELVAMVATDDKKPLTEDEVARGVQQMLILGVDTDRTAQAARAPRGKVTAMRMMAPKIPEGAQVTLDQALAASELPDEYAEQVLAAGGSWRFTAANIKTKMAEEGRRAKIVEVLSKAGIEVVDEEPEGMFRIKDIYSCDWTPGKVKKSVEGLENGCKALFLGYTLAIYGTEDAAKDKLAQDEIDMARGKSDSADLYERIAIFVVSGEAEHCQEINDAVRSERSFRLRPAATDEASERIKGLAEKRASSLMSVSRFEMEAHLMSIAERHIDRARICRNSYEADWANASDRCRRLLDAVDLCTSCGFETAERDRWLLGKCAEIAEKRDGERGGADGDD